MAINYWIQSVWEIVLALNMACFLTRSLILFRKAPWYCLPYYVQASITSEKRSIIVDHIKFNIIHGGLLVIFILQSKPRGWVIGIDLIFIFMRWNRKRYNICYCPFTYDDNLNLVMFYIKSSCIIFFLNNFESEISWYFLSQSFESVKEWHKLRSLISINSIIKNFTIPVTHEQQIPNNRSISGVSQSWRARS